MPPTDRRVGRVLSPRVYRLTANPSRTAVEEFWAEAVAAGGPLIEPWDDTMSLVTFLWRGEATETSTGLGVSMPLTRIEGTDLWHGSRLLPTDLRTIYCLRHDGPDGFPTHLGDTGPLHLDPINPRRLHFPRDPQDPDDSLDCWGSILELPDAPADRWARPTPGVTAGSITPAWMRSEALGYELAITLYQPAGTPVGGLPALVFFDGHLAQTVLRVPTILDNLIAAGRIAPVAALLVHNFEATRERELSPLPTLAQYVVDDLLTWAEATYGIGRPGYNVAAGMSYGGLAAVFLGLTRPDMFGGVIAHSGSFWWPAADHGEPGQLIRDAAQTPKSAVRFYLDVGTQETSPVAAGLPSQLEFCQAMHDALRTNGHQVTYAEYSGAHDYLNWRRTVADALEAVLPPYR
jgi:enterochelin esterase-like enzyme